MKYDLHILKTKKSLKDIWKIIKTDVFGNYTTGMKCRQASFGIQLFRYKKELIILKLEYSLYNYEQISMAIMECLGKKLKCDYWIEGVVVEYAEAYIDLYQYNEEKDIMVCIESIEYKDGIELTPEAKQKWKFDAHDIWVKMKEKLDWEILRQSILIECPDNDFTEKIGFDKRNVYLKQWIEKFGSVKNINKKICDLLYFIPLPDIDNSTSLYEGKVMTEKKNLGKIVIESEKIC